MRGAYGKETTDKKPEGQLSGSEMRVFASRPNGKGSMETDDLLQEIESLRTRLTKLSEASRRVSENLDLNIVLQEVIDSARYLTDARYGALLTYEPSGAIQDFLTSGLSAEEIKRLKTLPQGLGLLGYMNEIREPLRLTDIASHPRSVGFPENHPPMKTFLGMPIRHHGEHVGNIYLTEKEGGWEFTGEDQDVLVMFASQAGAAIFNARRYEEQQQARADLEALVNISPVGVLVFDAKTGVLVSANDETRRVVGKLHKTGSSINQILEVISLRRVDGSEIPMEELPTVKAMTRGETVLADEVVIHPKDGRAPITTLVNARPIRRDSGEIVSIVATIQDITPLAEMKRQRTEFLSNVSQELRIPLTAIKGSTSTLLSSPYSPGPDETRQFLRVIDEQADQMRYLINDLVDMTQIEAGTLSVNPGPTEMADLLREAREAYVHAVEANDSVELDLPSALPRVMADRQRILHVLSNLLVEVSSYSSKSSTVRITALLRDLHVAVTVDIQSASSAAPHLRHRFDGPSRVDDKVAGRLDGTGELGIAICKGVVEAHGGRLSVKRGEGDRGPGFTFTIPMVDDAAYLSEQGPARSPAVRDFRGRHARILVIGENPETGRYIRNTLLQAGFIAAVTGGLDEAEPLIENQEPHVVLLEPTSTWSDGFEMLVRVGRITDAPVIFVAGHGWDQQIRRVFELGAFDYIAKPFTSTELLARIDMALRGRSAASLKEPSRPYLHGNLAIDYLERGVTVSGRPVHLTATEYNLLAELSTAAGRVLTHEQLLRRVWGHRYSSDSGIVRTYIKELRHKLGDDAARPTYIFTAPGVGYRMARPSND